MRNLIATFVFLVVQILFIPLAIVGVVLLSIRQIWVSRRLGVSATATSVIGNRWIMDRFGTRPDPITRRLYPKLPNGSVLGLWLVALPSYLRYRVTGKPGGIFEFEPEGKENPAKVAFARTLYFDRLIARSIGSVLQMVTLGAGNDTRSFGDLRRYPVHFFELDEARTQQLKVASLQKARIAATQVTFVPVDFAAEDWSEHLLAAGFRRDEPTLFLWEGVTPYLEEADVRATLGKFCELAVPGSLLLLDIYDKSILAKVKGVKATDEAFIFGLDLVTNGEVNLWSFLHEQGCVLGDHYMMGHATKRGTFGAVCEAYAA